VLELVATFLNLLPVPPFDGFGIIEPIFTDVGSPAPRPHPAVFPLVLFVLLSPSGPSRTLWHSAYRVGYGMGVPHGVAGDGLQLARFWTAAPPPRRASSTNTTSQDGPYDFGKETSSIPAPTAVKAYVESNGQYVSVVLFWDQPSDFTEWHVYRGDDRTSFRHSQRCACAASPGGAADTDVVAGHRYTYYVVAESNNHKVFSHPASITVDVPSGTTAP
jgi:hypothetical protein